MSDAAAMLARLYDLDLAEDPGDLDLYLALAERAGDPILELAAGTGRIALPLAEAGHHVVAVDIEPSMLARARAALERAPAVEGSLELVEADLLDFRHPRRGAFRLAILALNSIMLLGSYRAQRDAVAAMAAALAPGGIAVIDAWQPDAEDLGRFDGRLMLEYLRHDPESGAEVAKSAAAWYDAASRRVTLTSIYDLARPGGPPVRWTRTDRLRLVAADELRGFVEDAGLVVEVLAGGYGLEPLAPGDDRAVVVALRPVRA